jgi:hypothetical protein
MIYLLLNWLTYIHTFGDQISGMYHSILSSVCSVVVRGLFWFFQTYIIRTRTRSKGVQSDLIQSVMSATGDNSTHDTLHLVRFRPSLNSFQY